MSVHSFLLSPSSNSFPSIPTPVHQPEECLLLPEIHQQKNSGNNGSGTFSPALVDPRSTVMEATFSGPSLSFVSPQPHHLMQPFQPNGNRIESSPGTPGSGFSFTSASTCTSPLDATTRPQLVNVVSTLSVGCRLNLKHVALHARNAEYNPKRFTAIIMRIREPRTTCLIFANGKLVCTGAKSEADSRLAARRYARILQKLDYPVQFLDFKIHNMVVSCDLKFPIRLECLVVAHSRFAAYEPELFPGLIYRMMKPHVVLLIFVTGKVVITGAKNRHQLFEAYENILPILKQFKKQ